MLRIQADGYQLELGSILESSFAKTLNELSENKVVILCDENTNESCLPYLISNFDGLSEAEVIVLPAGEENKQLELVKNVWEVFTEFELSRHDLLINLGGGMITDMGGFIASCYKRGMKFLNIPTSLLGMVDASIGGKTGVNLGHFKNQVGVFNNPIALYIDPVFLSTLPDEQLMSGYAEMIKHGLIHNRDLFMEVMEQMESPRDVSMSLLKSCIEVKNEVVKSDPFEGGLRKILNFGHTIGHAIEGHLLSTWKISHGHAIAIGMVMEAYVSEKKGFLPKADYDLIESRLLEFYPLPVFSNDDIQAMITMMSNDKKNKAGKVLCCLLNGIGNCTFNHALTNEELVEVYMHFKNKQINLN